MSAQNPATWSHGVPESREGDSEEWVRLGLPTSAQSPPVGPADLNEAAVTTFSVLGLFSSQAAAILSILLTAEVVPTTVR